MKNISLLALVSVLAACGGSDKGQNGENSELGSLTVKTLIPATMIPAVSKVEIIAQNASANETTYTLGSLAETNADIAIPAGDYTFKVRLYKKENERDTLFAQTVKDKVECPEVQATIKGARKTEINVTVCTSDNTVPLEGSTGSAGVTVGLSGFQELLTCELPVGTVAVQSMTIDAQLNPENKLKGLRVVIGKLDANGQAIKYSAILAAVTATTTSSNFNYIVQGKLGEQLGTLNMRSFSDYIFSYSLALNDGTSLSTTGLVNTNDQKCKLSTLKPTNLSRFLSGN